MRKGISTKEAKKFLSRAPVAKNKKKAQATLEKEITEKTTSVTKPRENQGETNVSGGALRGVIEETMARVYSEMWPAMETHTKDAVDIEISEEAYILTLTMVCGNPIDMPRRGLKIKDAEISDSAVFCGEHS